MDYMLLIQLVLLVLLMVTAIATIEATNTLTSVIMLCIFSLLMAAIYIVMGAPDVAMTEAAIGAGASTLILLAALLLLGEKEKAPTRPWLALLIVVPIFLLLCYALVDMPPYGAINTPAHEHLAKYYIERTSTEIAIPNIVTAILASYRGFDTLGEITVILTAGFAVFLLIGREKEHPKS